MAQNFWQTPVHDSQFQNFDKIPTGLQTGPGQADCVSYKCRNCGCDVLVTEAGRSVTVGRGVVDCLDARRAQVVRGPVAEHVPAAAPLAEVPNEVPGTDASKAKKPAAARKRKLQAPPPAEPKRVRIGGSDYSVPAWILGCPPSTRRYDLFREQHGKPANAILLMGGDSKTVGAGIAPEELLRSPERRLAPSKTWRYTRPEAAAERKGKDAPASLVVRRPSLDEDMTGVAARSVLWRLDVLKKFFLG